jgi:hypothetical protein
MFAYAEFTMKTANKKWGFSLEGYIGKTRPSWNAGFPRMIVSTRADRVSNVENEFAN